MRLAIYFNTHDNKNQEADVYISKTKIAIIIRQHLSIRVELRKKEYL